MKYDRSGTFRPSGTVEWLKSPAVDGPEAQRDPDVVDTVSTMLARIEDRGMDAVLEYARQFDGYDGGPIALDADDLAAGSLVRLLAEFEPPPLPLQLVARSGPHMPAKVRAFLDHAAAEFQELPVIRPSGAC
jgi:DNA-binding transcriptional LysR family regulator